MAKFQWFVGRGVLIWKIFSSCFIFSVITFPDEDPDFNVLFSNLHRKKLLVKQATCIQTYFSLKIRIRNNNEHYIQAHRLRKNPSRNLHDLLLYQKDQGRLKHLGVPDS